MRIALAVLVLVASCARGQAIETWTLDVAGGDHGMVVALPSNYLNGLPLQPIEYTLRATVAIDPSLRDRPIVLEIDAYNGALVARVDGAVLDDLGDPPVGWRRFAIPAAVVERGTVPIALTLRRDLRTMLGLQTAPVLAPAGDGTGSAIAAFNRYGALVSLAVGALLCVLYGAMYAFGRRPLDLAIAVWAVANALVVPLLLLGIPGELLGERVGLFVLYGGLLSLASYFVFTHLAFGLGPVSRRWWYAFGLVAGVSTIVILAGSLPGVVACWLALNLTVVVANLYGLSRVWRAARGGDTHGDAWLFLVFNGLTVALLFAEMSTLATGRPPFGPIHLTTVGITLQAIAQAVIVSRQHARQIGETEAASAAVQRQVAERSRELGDALRRLAERDATAPSRASLADWRTELTDADRARAVLAQIAEQLAELHGQGQVHGHLALAVVLLDGDTVRISGEGESPTVAGKAAHTASTPADDVLAFGRLAHELFTGEPPGELSGELATLPAPFGVLVTRCLDRDPARRPTATELAAELA